MEIKSDTSRWHAWPVNDTVFAHYLDRVIYACSKNNGTILYTTDPAGFEGKDIKWTLMSKTMPW